MRWLVLGGRANGLAVARALKRPKDVYVVDICKEMPVAAFSRYVKECFLIDNDFSNVSSFLDEFLSCEKAILIATDDWWVYCVSKYKALPGKSFFGFFPDVCLMERILDKKSLCELLENIVEMPKLYEAEQHAHIKEFVVKPRVPYDEKGIVKKGANNVAKYERIGVRTLIQECISAPMHCHLSVCGISIDGVISSPFFTSKLMQYPNPMGTATMIKSVHDEALKHSLLEKASCVMLKLQYSGIFELEFIASAKGLILIDFNPRFWLQHGMASLAGINYAKLYSILCIGEGCEEDVHVDERKLVWLHEGAMLSFFKARNKLDVLKALHSSRLTFAHFDFSDMRPFWRFLRCKLKWL